MSQPAPFFSPCSYAGDARAIADNKAAKVYRISAKLVEIAILETEQIARFGQIFTFSVTPPKHRGASFPSHQTFFFDSASLLWLLLCSYGSHFFIGFER